MKREFITILLVITTVLFAGCTGQDEPTVPEQVQQTITPVSTSYWTAAMTPHPVTTIVTEATSNPVQARIFQGDSNWAEYRENNTVTMPPNPRYQWESVVKIEHSADIYQGVPVIHEKITTTSDYPEWIGETLIHTDKGWITVTEKYFEVSTNKFLGGNTTDTIKGDLKPTKTLPAGEKSGPENHPSGEMGITPFGEMNITLTDQGVESVTVPAGTYPNARKYFGKFLDGTPITFWVVPDIPVPVQYQFPNKNIDGEDPFQSYELKGWG